jgi:hypothetical protein
MTVETPFPGAWRTIKGPAHTPELAAQAILLELGITPSESGGMPVLPGTVVSALAARAQKATEMIRAASTRMGEIALTGALLSSLAGVLQLEGWSIAISVYEYSSHLKEPHVGADGGIIFDIRDQAGRRTVKAMLIQSKLHQGQLPDTARELPGATDQLARMAQYTKDGYVVVFSPEDVAVYGPGGERVGTLAGVFADAAKCERADPAALAVAIAHDRRFVAKVIVSAKD